MEIIMTWSYPWVIAGIPEMPIDIARVFAYASTGGVEGVIGRTDLRVAATGTPSAAVTTSTGAFIAVSRFLGATYESYIARNSGSAVTTSVPNLGSSSGSQLVYAHITDPGQSGQPSSANIVETRVISCAAGTTSLQQVPGFEQQSGLALARIDRAANATVVNPADIKDLRFLASPRTSTQQLFLSYTGAGDELVVADGARRFPNTASWDIDVPSWATRIQWVGNMTGVRLEGASGANVAGSMRLQLGISANNVFTPYVPYDTSVGAGPYERITLPAAGETAIPSGIRGTTQNLLTYAFKTNGTARVWARSGTNISITVTFKEIATDS